MDYFGVSTPLNQTASISIPDARTIIISPFDKKLLGEIAKAVQLADVGVQPNNDGNVIRLPVPPLNEERRKQISKIIRKLCEDTKVGVRLVRQDANNKMKKMEKDKTLNKDDSKSSSKKIQTITDGFITKVDLLTKKKENEIMTL